VGRLNSTGLIEEVDDGFKQNEKVSYVIIGEFNRVLLVRFHKGRENIIHDMGLFQDLGCSLKFPDRARNRF